MKTISAMLGATYGGRWRYSPHSACWIDDQYRVVRTCTPMGGMSGDEPQQKEAWLYDGDKPPVRVQMLLTQRASAAAKRLARRSQHE